MSIVEVRSWCRPVPLKRPYTIAYATKSDVDLFFVALTDGGGRVGLGSGSPAEQVTGESVAAAAAALDGDALDWLRGADPRHLGRLCREAERRMAATPAARAAVDIALHDLFAQRLGVPLVDLFGRCHERLPTSITIGIMSTEEALAECAEYLGRGFRSLKVKIGHDLEEDLERLTRLRRAAGPEIAIRVDGNQGYDADAARALWTRARDLDLELIEQPLATADDHHLYDLPPALRRRLAADESLLHAGHALALARPPACGIYNIKLMKCGGVAGARAIATVAETAGIELMWGCMDESRISIAAALHAAYASPATRYLDLDGSFELSRDVAAGGFTIEDGCMRLMDAPGLGVRLCE